MVFGNSTLAEVSKLAYFLAMEALSRTLRALGEPQLPYLVYVVVRGTKPLCSQGLCGVKICSDCWQPRLHLHISV